MVMQVLSYLRRALRRKGNLKSTSKGTSSSENPRRDGDWDFGARQMPDSSTHGCPPAKAIATPADPLGSSPPRALLSDIHVHRDSFSQNRLAQEDEHVLPDLSLIDSRTDYRSHNKESHNSTVAIENYGIPFDKQTSAMATVPNKESVEESAQPLNIPEEDNVLMNAGEVAKESRGMSLNGEKSIERRRRAHSMAAARLIDPIDLHILHHSASSSSFQPTRAPPLPPLNSSLSLSTSNLSLDQLTDERKKRFGKHHALLQGKRSLPQLHRVWENFLEEMSEDTDTVSSSESCQERARPPRRTSSLSRGSFNKGHRMVRQSWRSSTALQVPNPVFKESQFNVYSEDSSTSSSDLLQDTKPLNVRPRSNYSKSSSVSRYLNQSTNRQGHTRSARTNYSSSSNQTGSMSSQTSTLNRSSVSSMMVVCNGNDFGDVKSGAPLYDKNAVTELELSVKCIPPNALSWRNNPSPTSLRSFSSYTQYSSSPHTPSHTPTTTPTTLNFPLTPPLSRSSSRSPTSILKRAGRPTPSPTPSHHLNQATPWHHQRSPRVPPDDHHDPFGVSGLPESSKLNAHGTGHILHTTPPSSVEDDVLVELDYYYGLPPHEGFNHFTASPSPSPQRQPNKLASFHSKSASNLYSAAKAAPSWEKPIDADPFAETPGLSLISGHRTEPSRNQLELILDSNTQSTSTNNLVLTNPVVVNPKAHDPNDAGNGKSGLSPHTLPPSPASSSKSSRIPRSAPDVHKPAQKQIRQLRQVASDLSLVPSRSLSNSPQSAARSADAHNANRISSHPSLRPTTPPGAVQWGLAL